MPYDYITTASDSLTTPPDSPKILEVETQDSPNRAADPRSQAFRSAVCPQTSVEVVGGCGTSVTHMLAMAFEDATMDDDLRETLAAQVIVLEE